MQVTSCSCKTKPDRVVSTRSPSARKTIGGGAENKGEAEPGTINRPIPTKWRYWPLEERETIEKKTERGKKAPGPNTTIYADRSALKNNRSKTPLGERTGKNYVEKGECSLNVFFVSAKTLIKKRQRFG